MEFLTAKQVADILQVSEFFVYQNRQLFGGVKFGRVVRFEKQLFEEVLNDHLQTSRQVAVRLLEERSASSGKRIQDQAGSERRRDGRQKKNRQDEFGLYKIIREQTARPEEKT
jgi:hypothetical protein